MERQRSYGTTGQYSAGIAPPNSFPSGLTENNASVGAGMKLIRFLAQGRPSLGILSGNEVAELDGDFFTPFRTLKTRCVFSQIQLLPPCTPSKIVAVGLNYRDHAKEMNL